MTELVYAVVGALAGTVIAGVAVRVGRASRGRFARVIEVLTGTHYEKAFRNKAAAATEIDRELARASHVRLLTGRGDDLRRDTFSRFLPPRATGATRFQILLPRVGAPGLWVEDREQELESFDVGYQNGVLRRSILSNVDFLRTFVDSDAITVSEYDFPHLGRLLLTERVAYLTPYTSRTHGRHDPVIRYYRGSETYYFFERLFNKVLQSSVHVPPARARDDAASASADQHNQPG